MTAPELRRLHALAKALGVYTHYTDGLGKHVTVSPETLVKVCAALGAEVASPTDAGQALRQYRATRRNALLPPVIVAWDGVLPAVRVSDAVSRYAELRLADGGLVPLRRSPGELRADSPIPFGYHHLTTETPGGAASCTVIAAPEQAWRRPGTHRSWGVGTQLAACRSSRSRSVGDLRDLESLCQWVHDRGGDLVTALPLLPTFNSEPAEPSPYSPVSRLFWSELILDLGNAHHATPPPDKLDVSQADVEVRAALSAEPLPDLIGMDEELVRYARFRGVQARLGRNWRAWPGAARAGSVSPDQVDADEERFHLTAQTLVRRQLHDVRQRLEQDGMRLGLDLAVGVHPDGYDPWSRQSLFADGMSVGAPPDLGFPSGQDWGFSPVLPEASRREGHSYIARSIAHQAEPAGMLRVDHIMAWTRLYWIPHGFELHAGTYISYPAEELFAVLTLESHRHRCEIAGENLGTVPREIDEALPRHKIWGMYLAQFEASSGHASKIAPPTARDIALIGTHDTPTFAGWLEGNDIDDRVRHGLLTESAAPRVREERAAAARALATRLGRDLENAGELLSDLLKWLGHSDSPLVIPWLEDLWLEDRGVNLPGTRSSECPNWQRPMSRLLDDIVNDPEVERLMRLLRDARSKFKGSEYLNGFNDSDPLNDALNATS
jgi:4-alpha-glucanotransferase